MQTIQQASNPFAMMIDPQSVLNAMESSARLACLHSEIYRPLDKPLLAKLPASVIAYDCEIDYEIDFDAEQPETEN